MPGHGLPHDRLDESDLSSLKETGSCCVAQLVQQHRELRAAAKVLVDLNVGDFVYAIRDRELLGWEGPKVTAWGNACARLQAEFAPPHTHARECWDNTEPGAAPQLVCGKAEVR